MNIIQEIISSANNHKIKKKLYNAIIYSISYE